MDSVSIIVPVYNHLPKVYRCLQSLTQTVKPNGVEILVQDDASTEYNMTELPVPPGFIVQRNPQNLGFAGNCNTAAGRARGHFLLFLNQDIQAIQYGWLDAMLALFENNEQVGIVGPKLVFENGHIQSCGGWFDAGKGPAHRYLGWQNIEDRRVNTTEQVAWITGAALMIRRADFYAVGGFDMGYPGGYFEDVDLCMKVKTELDKQVWYCAESMLIHTAGSTGGNPRFYDNARRFHELWDAHIEPDTIARLVNY